VLKYKVGDEDKVQCKSDGLAYVRFQKRKKTQIMMLGND
jgi:hypothetical protein